MSKYPVLYLSGSKKEPLQIEHMVTPHLCNAWRKLAKQIVEADASDPDINLNHTISVCAAMKDEIVDRGGVYDHDTDQWVFPPKDETSPEDYANGGYENESKAAQENYDRYEEEQLRTMDQRRDEGLDPITGRER